MGDLVFLELSCDIWQGGDGLESPASLGLEGGPLGAESMDLGTGLRSLQLNSIAYPLWPLHGCGGEDGGDLPEGAMGLKMPGSRASSQVSIPLVQEGCLLPAQLWQMQGVWHLWMPWPQLWNLPHREGGAGGQTPGWVLTHSTPALKSFLPCNRLCSPDRASISPSE